MDYFPDFNEPGYWLEIFLFLYVGCILFLIFYINTGFSNFFGNKKPSRIKLNLIGLFIITAIHVIGFLAFIVIFRIANPSLL